MGLCVCYSDTSGIVQPFPESEATVAAHCLQMYPSWRRGHNTAREWHLKSSPVSHLTLQKNVRLLYTQPFHVKTIRCVTDHNRLCALVHDVAVNYKYDPLCQWRSTHQHHQHPFAYSNPGIWGPMYPHDGVYHERQGYASPPSRFQGLTAIQRYALETQGLPLNPLSQDA